jgi:ubiquitin C-terminal hydrolase
MKNFSLVNIILFSLFAVIINTAHPMPPKLSNFGVSCYFNAVIQALNATDPLHDALARAVYDENFTKKFKQLMEEIENNSKKITDTLAAFYEAIVDKLTKLQQITKTNNLKKDIERIIQQEDASEFLILLTDSLKEPVVNKKLIEDIFSYQENLYFYAPGKNPRFNKEQPNDLLAIPVFEEVQTEEDEPLRYPVASVQESLNVHYKKEEQLIYDEEAEHNIPTILQRRLNNLSKILIISLKRFYFQSNRVTVIKNDKEVIEERGTTRKFQSSIEIPLLLNLEKYCTENVANPEYELYAVINHRGDRASSGHYIAYVKDEGMWYRCNDSVIEKVNFESVKNEIYNDGYILFYQQVTENLQKKEMLEAIEREAERLEKGRKALLEKIEAKKLQKEQEEAANLALVKQLEAEELLAEQERLKQRQEEEKKGLLEAQRIAAEQERLQKEEETRRRKAELEALEKEKLRIEKLEKDLKEEALRRKELEKEQQRIEERQRQEREALRRQELEEQRLQELLEKERRTEALRLERIKADRESKERKRKADELRLIEENQAEALRKKAIKGQAQVELRDLLQKLSPMLRETLQKLNTLKRK